MLPFGQGFPLGMPQPNLFRSGVVPGIPISSKIYILFNNVKLVTRYIIFNNEHS